MGYWSMILEFFNILVVNILTPCTIMHIVEFSMYCGVVCNGTSVPWRLMEEIMKDPKTSKNRFQNEFKNDLFLFLSALDTEVADYQHIEKSKGKKSVPKRRKRGSCEENRYQFNNHLQCLTLTDKDKVKSLELSMMHLILLLRSSSLHFLFRNKMTREKRRNKGDLVRKAVWMKYQDIPISLRRCLYFLMALVALHHRFAQMLWL